MNMSSLPDTPDFRNLLSSLTVTEVESDINVSSENEFLNVNRETAAPLTLFLNSTQTDSCKISALTRKLVDSWQGTRHPSNTRIAELSLAVFAVLKAGYPDSLTLFNRLLKSTVPVDISHFAVFLSKNENGVPAQFGGFLFGQVQNLALQYRSKRANSDYYNHSGERLRHRSGMESPIYKRVVMGFLDLYYQAPLLTAISDQLFVEVLLTYYDELSEHYTEQMWQDLDDRQLIGAAAGIEPFNVPSLKASIGLVTVAVYLNQTSHRWDGYVVPNERGLYSNHWIGSPPILQEIENYQSGIKFPISPTLTQVARYGVRARRAASQNEFAEALLNFTIALEMLFSERNQIGQTISRRLAVLISEPNPKSYAKSKKEIMSLYDNRSQYVHAGVQLAKENVELMACIFEKAYTVLVRLERRQILHIPESFTRWIHLLDWIASGYEVDQIPTHAIQLEIGIKSLTE